MNSLVRLCCPHIDINTFFIIIIIIMLVEFYNNNHHFFHAKVKGYKFFFNIRIKLAKFNEFFFLSLARVMLKYVYVHVSSLLLLFFMLGNFFLFFYIRIKFINEKNWFSRDFSFTFLVDVCMFIFFIHSFSFCDLGFHSFSFWWFCYKTLDSFFYLFESDSLSRIVYFITIYEIYRNI